MDTPQPTPSFFDDWRQNHYAYKNQFTSHQTSYIDGLLPEIAVQLSVFDVLDLLQKRLGNETVRRIFSPDQSIDSPVANQKNGDWMKKSRMVGINVRTVANYFNVMKYVLTLPSFHDSVHLLPIWEPGVVYSLYGKISFNINPEFYSPELGAAIPAMNSAENQLKALVNLCHALGKTVGMDVIPHTDRFSEMAILTPRNFEWVQRDGGHISSHAEYLVYDVENIIWNFLQKNGPANHAPVPFTREVFFNPDIPILTNRQRAEILFGYETDYQGRLHRRLGIMNQLVAHGFETLPMTMAPPYRSLHINPHRFIMDENGNKWYDYEFDQPQSMSRVFGPLTRYKFYHNQQDSWELDFTMPNKSAWDFVANAYQQTQQRFGFDFMRGDMAHVQPRPGGVPEVTPPYYDPLHFIKKYIQNSGVPYFAFFAETFLAPPDTMGYGDEVTHLERIEAEVTLGDIQSVPVGTEEFRQRLLNYIELAENKAFKPSFTLITGDKDDPRFDEFYRSGNMLRYFIGIFFNSLPSYYSLGFEVRERNLGRNQNETYTKLYVFKIEDDADVDKVTHGPFRWGRNFDQFNTLLELRRIGELISPELRNTDAFILKKPDDTSGMFIWTQYPSLRYIFVANLDPENDIDETELNNYLEKYSTKIKYAFKQDGQFECRIYEVI